MSLIERLQQTRDETLQYYDLPETDLDRSYGPGKWSIRYILHHLADAETILFDRIRRILSEPRQVIWAFRQDAWAEGLDYAARPLDLSKGLYAATRAGILYYADRCYEEKGHLEFVHSETGIRTLKMELEKVARHNQDHLDQIRRALEAEVAS